MNAFMLYNTAINSPIFFLVKFLNNLSWDFQKFLSLQILHILWTVFCSFCVYKYTQFVGNIEFVIDEIHNMKIAWINEQ